jgi:hypothetical protein
MSFNGACLWVVLPCGSKKARPFGGTYRLHFQDRRVSQVKQKHAGSRTAGFLFGLLVDPEDRGDTFHRHRWNSTELHGDASQKTVRTLHSHHCENFIKQNIFFRVRNLVLLNSWAV